MGKQVCRQRCGPAVLPGPIAGPGGSRPFEMVVPMINATGAGSVAHGELHAHHTRGVAAGPRVPVPVGGGQFLVKDLILLGVAVWTAGESLGGAAARGAR